MIRPSLWRREILRRELAKAISLISLGSNQILRLPHFNTDAARRFWSFSDTAQERRNTKSVKRVCSDEFDSNDYNSTRQLCSGEDRALKKHWRDEQMSFFRRSCIIHTIVRHCRTTFLPTIKHLRNQPPTNVILLYRWMWRRCYLNWHKQLITKAVGYLPGMVKRFWWRHKRYFGYQQGGREKEGERQERQQQGNNATFALCCWVSKKPGILRRNKYQLYGVSREVNRAKRKMVSGWAVKEVGGTYRLSVHLSSVT